MRFLFFSLFFVASLRAENPVAPLKIRPKSPPAKQRKEVLPPTNVTPFSSEEEEASEFRHEESTSFSDPSLQLGIVTPLGQEVFPEKRFKAWGDSLTLSLPLWDVGSKTSLHTEFGLGFTLIRLTLNQPAVSFSHTYFFFPVRARLVHSLSRNFLAEGFVGFTLRPWEYDSRSTTDGGFHSVKNQWLTPDFGVGLNYALTRAFFLRFHVGYAHLGLGGGLFL